MKRFLNHPAVMPSLVSLVVLGVLVAVFVAGTVINSHASPAHPAQPAVIIETLDPTLVPYAAGWQKEIGRRFDNAAGILVHGGDFIRGQWIVGTEPGQQHVEPIVDVVRRFQKLYPDRTMVLLACNPGHLNLGIPGVYYANSSVWCVPDRQVQQGDPVSRMTLDDEDSDHEATPAAAPPRSDIDPDVVGNIFEFGTD